jgi:septal ring factor EnvC (AmiA/AmiB activator)
MRMSKIKGYTPEEDCNNKGKAIKEDWNKVERELDRLYDERNEIDRMILVQKDLIKELRKEEAENVIQYVRSRSKRLNPQRIDTLLCHCQNMLNGNIDNTVLKFSEDDLEKENKK